MAEVYGDLQGVRKNTLVKLEAIYEMEVPFGQIITSDLLNLLLGLTRDLKRELAIYIDRRGRIKYVALGDWQSVSLSPANGREAAQRLSGIRCIHTHPDDNYALSQVDVNALKRMRFDVMVAVAAADPDGQAGLGFINGFSAKDYTVEEIGPIAGTELVNIDLNFLLRQIELQLASAATLRQSTLTIKERAVLIGLERDRGAEWGTTDSLQELKLLAEAAGAEVVAREIQRRSTPDAKYFIGQGKVQEISLLVQAKNANTVIIDDELTPAQQRNLENTLAVKVLDRTAVILDIFAKRARSHEGKLQVELAQLKYRLPRLSGQGLILSRLGGGIGTRGPGETKLETDRRRLRAKIAEIEKKIDDIKKHRDLQKKARRGLNAFSVSLVGYTNAGKSTLLNRLTAADVLAEDKLFATLDPTTRSIEYVKGQKIMLTDTVGFIRKIPHGLIAAFRATLEEITQADLLLHVVDASQPLYREQIEAVLAVLKEILVDTKPIITVFNKIDLVENDRLVERMLRNENSLAISAVTGQGIPELLDRIIDYSRRSVQSFTMIIPYEETKALAALYEIATVTGVSYEEKGIQVNVLAPENLLAGYHKYIVI